MKFCKNGMQQILYDGSNFGGSVHCRNTPYSVKRKAMMTRAISVDRDGRDETNIPIAEVW